MFILCSSASREFVIHTKRAARSISRTFCSTRSNASISAFEAPLTTQYIPTWQNDLDPLRPYVTIPLSSGRFVRRHIIPSSGTDSAKLIQGLNPLFHDPHYTRRLAERTFTFGSEKWHLDRRGDAIHKFLMLSNQNTGIYVTQLIKKAADEINHHPHLTEATGPDRRGKGSMWLVAITCTTHTPSGLSIRDVELAREIDKILEPVDIFNIQPYRPNESVRRAIHHKRALMKQANREKIWESNR